LTFESLIKVRELPLGIELRDKRRMIDDIIKRMKCLNLNSNIKIWFEVKLLLIIYYLFNIQINGQIHGF